MSVAKITLSFGEIETILGTRLPASARRHAAWWSNSTRSSNSRIWLGAGFHAHASLSDERVQFVGYMLTRFPPKRHDDEGAEGEK